MAKIVRLTENDLVNLVKRVMNEQSELMGMEMPNVDKMKSMFLSTDELTPEIKELSKEVKMAMQSCISENNLYKVKGFLDGIENKKMSLINTVMANLFDSKMGGKSIGQEFNEFTHCVRKKVGGKLDNM